ncbi:MAG: hypothetical protein LBR74_03750 [Eubacterium sp.]|jgi:hypothetical protein|nr:hypothetical protein [Eubacterium sp.]
MKIEKKPFALAIAATLTLLVACSSNTHKIVFPASDKGLTESNTAVYDIDPFGISFELPENWTLKEREPSGEFNSYIAISGVWSVLDIFNEGNELAGAVGYNTYEIYEGAETDPQAIYNQIALGNAYRFDVKDSYYILNETSNVETAVCDVYYSASINDGTEKINKGVVSYNRDLLVYIAMEFASDKISDEQLQNIAKELRFT